MVLKRKYRNVAEQTITSYNYTDIASGTGFITYYLGDIDSDYVLSQNPFWSDNVSISANSSQTTDVELFNRDYDIEFKKPQTIKGTGIFNATVCMESHSTGGASDTHHSYLKVYVRKWDGSTETEIVNDTSETFIKTASGDSEEMFKMVGIDLVIPETSFKVGESLRITVELHGWMQTGNGTGTARYAYGQDPKDRDTTEGDSFDFSNTGEPSIAQVQIPFKLNL